MKYYKQYFKQEISKLSIVGLWVFIVGIAIDVAVDYKLYAPWIHYFSYGALVIGLLLVVLIFARIIKSGVAGIIFAYVFTLNIYLPGFFADATYQAFVITSFTNLGACLILIILVYFTGALKHGIALGILNSIGIVVLYFRGLPEITFDAAVLMMFICSTVFFYLIMQRAEVILKENEEQRKSIVAYRQKLNDIRWQEEQKRVSFLSMMHEDHKNFTKGLLDKMRTIVAEKRCEQKDILLKEQIKYCKIQRLSNTQLNMSERIKNIDTEFMARIQTKYPDLTHIEQQICSLLRYQLTTQDIADRFNKSYETVKWYRKRIRKKLNLPSDKDLVDFCLQI